MDSSIQDFILAHRTDDIARLPLVTGSMSAENRLYVMRQIKGWQTARKKIPSWSRIGDLLYPQSLSLEQCSSELTALYKRHQVELFFKSIGITPTSMADITGGFGVDAFFLSPLFCSVDYIERNGDLCDIAGHNSKCLNITGLNVVCDDGIEYLTASEQHYNLIFADPARRDEHGGRTYAISDCTPDILSSLDMLLSHCDVLMLKLSPMLDWHDVVSRINTGRGNVVAELHIVSVDNECRELLVVITAHPKVPMRIFCVNNEQSFLFCPDETDKGGFFVSKEDLVPGSWLHVPNSSIMKAGCFSILSSHFEMGAFSANSHLFLSSRKIEGFPGKTYLIDRISSLNKKELRKNLSGIDKANIAVRNFPMTVAELRNKLRLKDGGNTYVFATSLSDGSRVLVICRRDFTE